ncbi:hypothetical protein PspLS_04855 [Pyricularia sp. CBS 133598]|nr:hypothetical protein PspLS_04855 [Pyricularia sp. CBS 133598]
MPSSVGKRTRSSGNNDTELPTKRTRLQTRTLQINDENRDPRDICSIDTVLEDHESIFPAKSPLKKFAAPLTPKTPRFRDALSDSPSTPRHRVMSVGKLSTRLTPKTPSTPATCQTIYHLARQLFSRSNDPGGLIGRDDERASLEAFLAKCTSSTPNGCLYVSGPPGTGKSAMVNAVTDELVSKTPSVRKAYINCMSVKSSNDLYVTLLEQLGDEINMLESEPAAALQQLFIPKRKAASAFLIVLDEIDHILSLDLESLYKIFEWSMQKSSRVSLVGIANALDLTDRFLPRLKSRNLKPELLPFLPYSAPQIKAIVTDRLKSLMPAGSTNAGFTPFFHPAAIELCSRKVSSQTGDLRKAYEILRRALDLVESETKRKLEEEARQKILQMTPSKRPLGETPNNAGSPSKDASRRTVPAELAASLQALTVENAPRVSISHLNKITATAFGNGASQRLKSLNLQQKAALCSLMAIEKKNKAAVAAVSPTTPSKARVTAPTVKTLYDTYSLLCKRDSLLHVLSSSEFREVIGSLETLSLVTAVDGKTGSFAVLQTPSKKGRKATFSNGDERRVASCVGEKEIEQGIEGLGSDILKSILSGEALD